MGSVCLSLLASPIFVCFATGVDASYTLFAILAWWVQIDPNCCRDVNWVWKSEYVMFDDFIEEMLRWCLASSQEVGQVVSVYFTLGVVHLTARNMRLRSLFRLANFGARAHVCVCVCVCGRCYYRG